MTRLSVILSVALVVGILGFFSAPRGPDPDVTSAQEREAAANEPLFRTEYDTQGDETQRAVTADDDEVTQGPGSTKVFAGEGYDRELLTVEGYDALQVRLLLLETDMAVETREEYLGRLRNAYGDDDAMAEVLQDLRSDLQSI